MRCVAVVYVYARKYSGHSFAELIFFSIFMRALFTT